MDGAGVFDDGDSLSFDNNTMHIAHCTLHKHI